MTNTKFLPGVVTMLFTCMAVAAAFAESFPYEAAGLTERRAAAHLLDRFAYGPRPGDIDQVVEMGLEAWLAAQLSGAVDDSSFEKLAAGLDSRSMKLEEMLETFPPPAQVFREAQRAGVISRDSGLPVRGGDNDAERREVRRSLMGYFQEKGYRPQRELIAQMTAHKVFQAVVSEHQLEAVLTDFWFNHFNVSLTDNQSRPFVAAYERDAIAPGVLGSFHDMLVETAAHPAMLTYLDNFQSTANEGVRTTLEAGAPFGPPRGRRRARMRADRPQRARPQGLNENYARELLELHTLGVDGGYSQEDVVEVARAFSGWGVVPFGPQAADAQRQIARVRSVGADLGFVVRESFIFRADVHDAETKTVLGHDLEAGRGIDDGLEVLDILASHPSTAAHVARKLAVRFVSDEPPQGVIDRLAATYLESGGQIAELIRTLAYSPEFWAQEARGQKIKSPFELAVSAVRALGASVVDPADLIDWVSRMGQPLYTYQAPTGYPDRALSWVNTGSLLTRMNFGLGLATGRVMGVELDLAALNDDREPESLSEALEVYAGLLLPERELTSTLEQLYPVIHDPKIGECVAEAAPEEGSAPPRARGRYGQLRPPEDFPMLAGRRRREALRELASSTPPSPLANVVGVILGSPEFQRR